MFFVYIIAKTILLHPVKLSQYRNVIVHAAMTAATYHFIFFLLIQT